MEEDVGVEVVGGFGRGDGVAAVACRGAGACVVQVHGGVVVGDVVVGEGGDGLTVSVGFAGFDGFVEAGLHVWPLLLGAAALGFLLLGLLETRESAAAHAALAVAGKGVVAREALRARADEGSVVAVDRDVALEVVLADEGLVAEIALELAVAEVRLYMRADVLLAAEASVAAFPEAGVSTVGLVLLADELLDLVRGDTGVDNAGGDLRAEIVDESLARRDWDWAFEVVVLVDEVAAGSCSRLEEEGWRYVVHNLRAVAVERW